MQKQERRPLKVVVMSDLHLGTFGCQARNIISYLRSIKPEILVLNGDIIDIWQFNKRYFPSTHMQVIKEIFSLLSSGTKVYYITGNHDDIFRKYSDLNLGDFTLTDKLIIELDGKKTWIFHGDIFDATTKGWARVLAKLGGKGYDLLIMLNLAINWVLKLFGKEKMSFSKKVKNSVKKAVRWIGDFEATASELAISQGYQHVICGHIHNPQNRMVTTEKGSVRYLNSGDWVEHCSALEYQQGEWNLHFHEADKNEEKIPSSKDQMPIPNVISDAISLLLQTA